jgi:hypothetical protein
MNSTAQESIDFPPYCGYNPLYKSVQINHNLMNQWFHPAVHAPEKRDSVERGTYSGDMEGLSENDLHNATDNIADGTITSAVVYSDVEGQHQNPELNCKMVTTTLMKRPREGTSEVDAERPEQVPVITWASDGRQVLTIRRLISKGINITSSPIS